MPLAIGKGLRVDFLNQFQVLIPRLAISFQSSMMNSVIELTEHKKGIRIEHEEKALAALAAGGKRFLRKGSCGIKWNDPAKKENGERTKELVYRDDALRSPTIIKIPN